jgi:predicted phage baseplate assembly protein
VEIAPSVGDILRWRLHNPKGISGTVYATLDVFVLAPLPDHAETLIETATNIASPPDAESQDTLTLGSPLQNAYDPGSLRIAANVALASHGDTRTEILGGGNGSALGQSFKLKDSPLTYVPAAVSTGCKSTLSIRVNGVLWNERRSLSGADAHERVYMTRIDDDGKTVITFGGAPLPSGLQNAQATYRVGSGLKGQVGPGKLTQLVGAPLGVKAVTNPLAASGAADPETGERARRNAPLTVLALDRIVSLQDVEDFAAAFTGIGKAQAVRLWDGDADLVHVTVSADDGTPPPTDSVTLQNLRRAILEQGGARRGIHVDPYLQLRFKLEAIVNTQPEFEPSQVQEAVLASLADEFSFERRSFGQSVWQSEVAAVIQGVQGVEAVELSTLYPVGEAAALNDVLSSSVATFSGGQLHAAQLLTLADDGAKVTIA